MEVEILSKMLIKPSIQTPPHHQTHSLSFLDTLATPSHVPTVFFYPFNPISSSTTTTTILEHLKKSLSEVLSFYPPLAGRFNGDGFSVSCKDQGVIFMEAHFNGQLSEFLPKAYDNLSRLFDFFQKDIGYVKLVTTPMLSIQTTTFECGGLALAILRSHSIADGVSATTFIHHWSTISRRLFHENNNNINTIVTTPLQYFQMENLFPMNILGSNNKVSNVSAATSVDADADVASADTMIISSKVFFFKADAISTLKEKVKYIYRPSRLAVVVGTIWKALILISRSKHGYLRPSTLLSFTFNLRGRTTLIPKNSFGNSYLHIPIRFSGNYGNDNTDEEVELLPHLVGLIGDAIKNTALAVSKASTKEEMALLANKLDNQIKDDKKNASIDVYAFSSWCKFPFYDMDFGWGMPIWIGTCLLNFKVVILTDTKCGTGIEAKFGLLDQTDMLQFECHSDIQTFTSPHP